MTEKDNICFGYDSLKVKIIVLDKKYLYSSHFSSLSMKRNIEVEFYSIILNYKLYQLIEVAQFAFLL